MNSMPKQGTINKRKIGKNYEDVAAAYLSQKGYDIITSNYRCKLGEIDLIASIEGELVFVEVKYRKTSTYGLPREAVNFYKMKRIISIAQVYMKQNYKKEVLCRFDVIEILDEQITHLEAAF